MLSSPLFFVAGLEVVLYAWGIWQARRLRSQGKRGLFAALLLGLALLGRLLTLLQTLRPALGNPYLSETYLAFGLAIGLWLTLLVFTGRSLLAGGLLAAAWVSLIAALGLWSSRLPEIVWQYGIYLLPRTAVPALAAFGGWLTLGLAMSGVVLSESRRALQPLYRNRLAYWVPILLAHVLDGLTTFVWSQPLFHPLRAGMVLLVLYLVTHHRVRNLRQVLSRVFTYLITIVLLVFLYLGAALFAQLIFRQADGYNPLWGGAVIALGLAILFTPLLQWMQQRINRWLHTETLDASRVVQLYSQNISNILEMQRLAHVAVTLVMEAVGLQRGFLFLVDTEETSGQLKRYHLRAVRSPAERQIKVLTLPEDHPVVKHLLTGESLLQYDLDLLPTFSALSPLEREWFRRLETEVYVPIFSKGRWIGLFAFGPRLNAQPFTEQDLTLLTALAHQTAVALENARLVEDLVRLNRQLRQATRALEQARREVERLDRTRSDFINIASHELRTPLTVVRGYVEMLLENPSLDAELRTFLQNIHDGTMRMHDILESMFAIAALTHHPTALEMEMVDCGALAQEVAEGLVPRLLQRSQTLTLDLPPLPLVPGDRELLQKVFWHLLENGIKFTPDHGQLRIRAQLNPPSAEFPHGGLELIFSDTGVGVDPNLREAIFTKFYQGGDVQRHSTSKVRFMGGGSGLGLALCKAVVEAHRGRIWVESPGYDEISFPGSHFHVLLPLQRPPEGQTIRMGSAVRRTYP